MTETLALLHKEIHYGIQTYAAMIDLSQSYVERQTTICHCSETQINTVIP
jgi:hypothetical protein